MRRHPTTGHANGLKPDGGRRTGTRRAATGLALIAPVAALGLAIGPPGVPVGAATLLAGTAYVANWASNNVTPINTENDTPGTPIGVGSKPDAIAITPDGATAYVANWGSGNVTPINLATGKAEKAIKVGLHPDAIAITPDGTTAYVANFGSSSVTPINLAKNKAGSSIGIDTSAHPGSSTHPDAIAIAPLGSPVYVTSQTWHNVVQINTFDNKVQGKPSGVNLDPTSFTISPDGTTGLVTNLSNDTVTPITMATGARGTAIPVGALPRDVAFSPDGAVAYVSDFGQNLVTPVDTVTGTPLTPIFAGTSPMGLAVTPDGSTVYVANSGSDSVTPIDTSTSTSGTAIHVGRAPDAIAITPGWTDQSFVSWSGPNASSGSASTVLSPAFAYLGHTLYAVWTDMVSGDQLLYSSFNGTSWAVAQEVAWSGPSAGSALSSAAPALASDGSTLLLAWKGKDTGAAGVWFSSFNGSTWAPQQELASAITFEAPAIASNDGLPTITWTDGNDTINYSEETGPSTWSAPVKPTNAKGQVIITPDGPALSFSAELDTLILGWTNGNNTIGYLPLNDLSAQGTVPEALTGTTPALATMGDAVYVAWTGLRSNRIGYSGSWPVFQKWGSWKRQQFEPQALTDQAPTLAVTGYTLTAGWKGLTGDDIGFASTNSPY
jgi:YVTN family beta-propeller protein